MKTSYIIAALSAFIGVQAGEAGEAGGVSTVIAPECKPPSSTPDIVTRSALPTTPCNAPPLTTVPLLTTSTKTSTKVYTITKCPETVQNCPIGKKTTEVVVYTTVCPVATPEGGNQGPAGSGMPPPPPYNSKGGPAATGVSPPGGAPPPVIAGTRSNMVVGSVGGVLALAVAAVILV